MIGLTRERPAGREVEFLADAGAGGVVPKPFGVGGKLNSHPVLGAAFHWLICFWVQHRAS